MSCPFQNIVLKNTLGISYVPTEYTMPNESYAVVNNSLKFVTSVNSNDQYLVKNLTLNSKPLLDLGLTKVKGLNQLVWNSMYPYSTIVNLDPGKYTFMFVHDDISSVSVKLSLSNVIPSSNYTFVCSPYSNYEIIGIVTSNTMQINIASNTTVNTLSSNNCLIITQI